MTGYRCAGSGYLFVEMSGTRLDAFDLVVPCDPSAPGKVRSELEKLEMVEQVRDDAKFVASELVSNVVLHSGSNTPDHVIEVRVRSTPEVLVMSIRDSGLSDPIRQVRDNPDIGLGLQIVEQLADGWGIEEPDGRLVWAELLV
jgi:anti-sigma regulatory factor (Ser/Thr protein kinase)